MRSPLNLLLLLPFLEAPFLAVPPLDVLLAVLLLAAPFFELPAFATAGDPLDLVERGDVAFPLADAFRAELLPVGFFVLVAVDALVLDADLVAVARAIVIECPDIVMLWAKLPTWNAGGASPNW